MSPASNLRVTLVQTALAWENKTANLDHLERLLEAASPQTDVIVLPEMFATGFSMNAAALAEADTGTSVQWMQRQAEKFGAAVVGSLIIGEEGKYFNRLFWVWPGGGFQTYNKRHLFSFANEEQHFAAGNSRLVVEYKGWRICPLVCYDLRFPVWSRNNTLDGTPADTVFDLLIYVANWPEARRRPWMCLLEARAHENQVYVAGVNRTGADGNGIPHSGDSALYSPKGECLSTIGPHEEKVETVELNWAELADFREKFTVWKDKDDFRLRP